MMLHILSVLAAWPRTQERLCSSRGLAIWIVKLRSTSKRQLSGLLLELHMLSD